MTREEAIELLRELSNFVATPTETDEALNMAIEALEQEPKRGKWIRNENGTYSCSLCQSWVPEEQYHYARFCLHCGARMESDE